MSQGVGWAKACLNAGAQDKAYRVRGGNKNMDPDLMRRRRIDRMKNDRTVMRRRRKVVYVYIFLFSIPLSIFGAFGLCSSQVIQHGNYLSFFIVILSAIYGIFSLYQNISTVIFVSKNLKKLKIVLLSLQK